MPNITLLFVGVKYFYAADFSAVAALTAAFGEESGFVEQYFKAVSIAYALKHGSIKFL